MEIRYSILDPTGNITALVESAVEPSRQTEIASALMRLHPEVEQVGFLRPDGPEGLPTLRMAGGEFCGNASMCAAALLLLDAEKAHAMLRICVSGAAQPVELRLEQMGTAEYQADILMPPAVEIRQREFSFGALRGSLPLVRMEGISHLVVEASSPFFALRERRSEAERAVRALCTALGADGLGLLFLEGAGDMRAMTPLVYVPGSGTVFWENSCASGSAAVGMVLAEKNAAAVDLRLDEPGGLLHVTSDPAKGETRLRGSVRLLARYGDGR